MPDIFDAPIPDLFVLRGTYPPTLRRIQRTETMGLHKQSWDCIPESMPKRSFLAAQLPGELDEEEGGGIPPEEVGFKPVC